MQHMIHCLAQEEAERPCVWLRRTSRPYARMLALVQARWHTMSRGMFLYLNTRWRGCTLATSEADVKMDAIRRARIAALAGILIILQDTELHRRIKIDVQKKVVKRQTRRWWVRPWILRKSLTECNTVYKLQLELEKYVLKENTIKCQEIINNQAISKQ